MMWNAENGCLRGYNEKGWTDFAYTLSEMYGVSPEDLWPKECPRLQLDKYARQLLAEDARNRAAVDAPDQILCAKEQTRLLYEMLERLPFHYRRAVMGFLEEETREEIGREVYSTRCPVSRSAVGNIIARAIDLIRVELKRNATASEVLLGLNAIGLKNEI